MYRILWFRIQYCKHWPSSHLPSTDDPFCVWNLPKRGLEWLGPLVLKKIEKRILEEIADWRREEHSDPIIRLRASVLSTRVEIEVESVVWICGRQEYFNVNGTLVHFPAYDHKAIKARLDAEQREINLDRIARCETQEDLDAEFARQEIDIQRQYQEISGR